ncbi:TonB-dependent Receptor Plug Domain [Lysobacter sp. yr284]|nr:TonB-dependent Receptor Plug Domain [Lysobacter sp. yr284]
MASRNPVAPRRHRLSCALLAALVLPNAGLALAQDVATDKDAKPSAEEVASKNATSLETVTVTGSRIGRDTFTSVSPLQVITREETTLAGFNSTTGALQSTSVTGGQGQINNAYGGFVTNGGPGANTVGLRGMDPTRTLILLNGRRVAPAGSRGSVGSADLNVLPTSMIDHIEVLKDGASSIYGSDAIAGVINIVTRKNINELAVEAQYNVTEDGGGDETRYSLSWGKTGDRFSISGSFEAYDRNELTLGDRDWTRCNTDYRRTVTRDGSGNVTGVGEWGSADFKDPLTGMPKCYPITGTGSNGSAINSIGTELRPGVGAAGSVGNIFNRWRPNSSVSTGLVGYEGVAGGATNTNVRDTFDPRMLNRSLISPVEVKTGYIQGAYDLQALGNAEVYFELLGNRRESSQTGYSQLTLDYARGSILLPAQLQNALFQAQPTEISNGRPVAVRAFIGFGNNHSSQTVDFWKATGGLRGDFVWTDWRYDFMVSKSRSDADYTFDSFLTDRLARSLDVVAGPGGVVCRDPSGGCVAAPFLTTQVVGGKLPQDWKNYVYRPVTGNTLYEESTVNFSIDGPLFSLPYGDVRGAFGVEYRRAKIDDTPSADGVARNLYNLTSGDPTRGKDSVKEIYGEIEVPVLSGLKGAEELTFNLSARYTDYKSYGSDNTYKIGGLWTPLSWLTVRASYGTSYRAPALFEQFLGATTGFLSNSVDPCNNYGVDPDASISLAANCASEGLVPNFNATSGVTVINNGGAAQGLKAETSKNFTGGIILQPEMPKSWGDLSFAVDYYKIEVENGVARAGGAEILDRCYNDPDFRAGGGFCRLVAARAPGSNALTVQDSYVNLATDRVRGLDFTVRYVRDVGPGTLRTTLQATHFLEQSNKLFAEDALDDYNGNIGSPSMTATLDTTYDWKNWKFRYGLEWVDAMQSYGYYGLDRNTAAFKMHTEDYYLSHISAQFKLDKWTFTGGVRNLFDAEPKKISQSGAYNRVGNAPLYSGYDYVGRAFFLNVQAKF